MNCQECLSELATGSLRDLTPESAVMRHCATCPYCGPLATVLRDREYNAATILNSLPPISNPIAVAEAAGMLSRRRRVGKVVVFLTGAALAATIFTSLFVTDFGKRVMGINNAALFTETIHLACLSPEQAGGIIQPYLRTRGSLYYADKNGMQAITVRGTEGQIAKSKQLIREFENDPKAACRYLPFAKVEEVLKRVGRPRPEPSTAPVVAPSPDVAPTTEKK
jgi:hypothetical protein